jgi:hypothetical protein
MTSQGHLNGFYCTSGISTQQGKLQLLAVQFPARYPFYTPQVESNSWKRLKEAGKSVVPGNWSLWPVSERGCSLGCWFTFEFGRTRRSRFKSILPLVPQAATCEKVYWTANDWIEGGSNAASSCPIADRNRRRTMSGIDILPGPLCTTRLMDFELDQLQHVLHDPPKGHARNRPQEVHLEESR